MSKFIWARFLCHVMTFNFTAMQHCKTEVSRLQFRSGQLLPPSGDFLCDTVCISDSLTLRYLWGRQTVAPAQHQGCISLA